MARRKPFRTVRSALIADAGIVTTFGQRLYAGVALPAGYRNSSGPALLFNTRGGDQDYTNIVHTYSLQFRVYAPNSEAAEDADDVLYGYLNGLQTNGIYYAEREVEPQLLQESDADWPFLLTFYSIQLKGA